METLIKTLADGTEFSFNTEDGCFTFQGKKSSAYANTVALRQDAKEINGVLITHIIEINLRYKVGLSAEQARLTQSLIDDYRAMMRKKYAKSNAQKRAMNLLLSEGYDNEFAYRLSQDDDHINPAA